MAQAIVTTNDEKSAEAEVADCGSVKAKGRIVYCQKLNVCVSVIICNQMSEEELSFRDDRAYPDNRKGVMITDMRSNSKGNKARNRRMPNGTYGGVRGKETK